MLFLCFLFILLKLRISDTFLLDASNSTVNGLTSFEFRHLAGLISEERQSRHQLETYVRGLEQELKNTKQQLIETNVVLAQKINTSEQTIAALNHTLNKEKFNRHQLQQGYTRLMTNFQNLSIANGALEEKNRKLEEKIYNITLDNTQSNMSDIDSFQQRLVKVEAETKAVQQSLVTGQAQSSSNNAAISSNQAGIYKLKAQVSACSVNMSSLHSEIMKLQRKSDYKSGFTVTQPSDGPSYGLLSFSKVVSNIGNHFNSSSGLFTCEYPGLYFFSMAIYKRTSTAYAMCGIKKNENDLVQAYSYPDTQTVTDLHEASNFVIVHLTHGDTVYLTSCTPAYTMYADTSFSGFLLKAD